MFGKNKNIKILQHVRFYLLILCFPFIAFLMLTACGTEDQTAKQEPDPIFDTPFYDWEASVQAPVTIWTREHDLDRIYMQRAIDRYRELTGSEVNIITFPQDQFESEVQQMLRSGEKQADLLLSYGGTNVESFHPDENFYDFTNAPWVKDLTASSINQTIYHGRVIGLPHWESSVSGTLYNKKIFDKLGIEVPENQKEFLEVCQTLKDNGIIPLYLPYQVSSMMLYQFPMDSILEDTDLLEGLNNGTRSYSDIPEMKKVVEWYRTMADRGYLGENYQENNWDGMDPAMTSEEYGMMLCWDTWLYTDFSGDASSFGLMPAFMGVPDQGTFEGPNQALLIVNKHAPNLNSALNFITFLADPYNYNAAFSGIYTAPSFRNQATSITTPQYVAAERIIEDKFRDSIAWLRVRGFSQLDAACIQKYMISHSGYSAEQCLKEMDQMRKSRVIFPENGR